MYWAVVCRLDVFVAVGVVVGAAAVGAGAPIKYPLFHIHSKFASGSADRI